MREVAWKLDRLRGSRLAVCRAGHLSGYVRTGRRRWKRRPGWRGLHCTCPLQAPTFALFAGAFALLLAALSSEVCVAVPGQACDPTKG
jgi:hypothetical protein